MWILSIEVCHFVSWHGNCRIGWTLCLVCQKEKLYVPDCMLKGDYWKGLSILSLLKGPYCLLGWIGSVHILFLTSVLIQNILIIFQKRREYLLWQPQVKKPLLLVDKLTKN